MARQPVKLRSAMSDRANYAYFLNGCNPDADSLVKTALEDFRDRSGLSPETLERATVRLFSGNADTLKERLGFASFGGQAILKTSRLVEIPAFDLDGNITSWSFRLYPTLDGTRYLHPEGQPARPYILPEVWAVREKTNKPLWFTEGAKKALKLIQHDIPTIGLAGVWNFRSGDEPFLFDDIELFSWRGRTVYIGFDMDLWTNPQVRRAFYELVFKLLSRSAVIRFLKWTEGKGIDDYLVGQENPENALDEMQDKALPFDKFISLEHRDEIVRALKLTHTAFDNLSLESIVTTIAKKLGIRPKRLFLELKEEKPKEAGFTNDEKTAALELLKRSDLVQRFLDACHTRYLGRDRTLILIKLATLTRHLQRALSVVLSGTSSVGKSALIEAVLQTCDPAVMENFSRMSAQYMLYREGDLSHRIVTFYELNGANSSAEIIRTAITEGELRMGTVMKNAQGSLAATDIRKETAGLVILSTFTGSRVDPELATRVLLQEITHDEGLTRAVYQAKAREKTDHQDVFRLWMAADSLLEGKPVDIPYLPRLADSFPTSEERFHRDFDKTVMLIKASALFHQYQREITEAGHIIATEEDYRLVYSLGDAFTQSLMPVSAPALNMLVTARDMGTPTWEELQKVVGRSRPTMNRYIKQLLGGEYITLEGRGKKQTITVLDIPERRSILPNPKNIFSISGEPMSQSPDCVDSSGKKTAQPPLSHDEPNEPNRESMDIGTAGTAQMAHTGSNPYEPENSLHLQGNNGNGSTAHEKEKLFFEMEQEDDLPEVEVL